MAISVKAGLFRSCRRLYRTSFHNEDISTLLRYRTIGKSKRHEIDLTGRLRPREHSGRPDHPLVRSAVDLRAADRSKATSSQKPKVTGTRFAALKNGYATSLARQASDAPGKKFSPASIF